MLLGEHRVDKADQGKRPGTGTGAKRPETRQVYPQPMKRALERRDSILLTAVTAAGGQVVKMTGDGLMAVFGSAACTVDASPG